MSNNNDIDKINQLLKDCDSIDDVLDNKQIKEFSVKLENFDFTIKKFDLVIEKDKYSNGYKC